MPNIPIVATMATIENIAFTLIAWFSDDYYWVLIAQLGFVSLLAHHGQYLNGSILAIGAHSPTVLITGQTQQHRMLVSMSTI